MSSLVVLLFSEIKKADSLLQRKRLCVKAGGGLRSKTKVGLSEQREVLKSRGKANW